VINVSKYSREVNDVASVLFFNFGSKIVCGLHLLLTFILFIVTTFVARNNKVL
jgi:hypothetical protein